MFFFFIPALWQGKTNRSSFFANSYGMAVKWIHETFPNQRLFAWQEKHGVFSVSVSQLDTIIAYIKNQEKHHRKMTFQEEFAALLKKHKMEFDERYLWD